MKPKYYKFKQAEFKTDQPVTRNIGTEFTERTGQVNKWITDRDWTILMNNKKLKKYPMCRDCMNKSDFKFTIWWWAKTECSCCGVLGSDLYKEGKGLVIASIRYFDSQGVWIPD